MTAMCARGLHPRTRENTYRRPFTGFLDCKPCLRESANRGRKPKPRKPIKRAVLTPAELARLRSLEGIPATGPTREQRKRWQLQEARP